MANGGIRNQSLDMGRLIAALGVISAHIAPHDILTKQSLVIFSFCRLPYFYLLSVIFFVFSIRSYGLSGEILGKRLIRIGIPYLIWSGIYSAMIGMKSLVATSHKEWDWIGALFYGQTAVHIYFLTIILWMHLLIFCLFRLFGKQNVAFMLASICALTFFAYFGFSRKYYGWETILVVFPFMLLGILLGLSANWKFVSLSDSVSLRDRSRYIFVGGVMFLGAVLYKFGETSNYVKIDNIALIVGGVGYFIFISSIRLKFRSPIIQLLFSVSYGIYLSHFMFVEAFEFLMEKAGFKPDLYMWYHNLIFTLLVFMVSACFVVVVRRSRKLKFCLFGE